MGKRSGTLEKLVIDLSFWKDKNVFITGHTGFKGSWLCKILLNAGAKLTGYALEPPANPNLFELCDLSKKMASVTGDIRDREKLFEVFSKANPEIVIHMAAQPIVRDSYIDPAYTYDTNVMGTVNILECIRLHDFVMSFLNVTTDKVYHNDERETGYCENDVLNGYDPYSNSKSCSELVTQSYKKSFFSNTGIAISTARSGNVIGGGDFSNDRIIPDCIRAAMKSEPVIVRNPNSIRPYQHVLDPLFAYLIIVQKQFENISYADNYNVGPDDKDCITTGELVNIFCDLWGNNQSWETCDAGGPHEAGFLRLDCSKFKTTFNRKPRWDVHKAVSKTVEWTRVYQKRGNICDIMDRQINEFIVGAN